MKGKSVNRIIVAASAFIMTVEFIIFLITKWGKQGQIDGSKYTVGAGHAIFVLVLMIIFLILEIICLRLIRSRHWWCKALGAMYLFGLVFGVVVFSVFLLA